MTICAIVNPQSRGGKTAKYWSQLHLKLREKLGDIEVRFSERPNHATELTRRALQEGFETIIAVGGDGTFNEVINGFFIADEPINKKAVLALLPHGTGGDFRRTFDIPDDIDGAIERIVNAKPRPLDIGRLSYVAHDGSSQIRFFNNICSFGMSGKVDQAVNRSKVARLFGTKVTFLWHTFVTALTYKNQPCRVRITALSGGDLQSNDDGNNEDESYDKELNVNVVAIANGQYFGSGLKVAPDARPDDGLFDVVIMPDISAKDMLTGAVSMNDGSHLADVRVELVRGRRVCAEPLNPSEEVLIDLDGEAPGRLPATFEIMPGALLIKA